MLWFCCWNAYNLRFYIHILLQLFHEEMVLQWIVIHPLSRPLVLKNAWFFFELLVSK